MLKYTLMKHSEHHKLPKKDQWVLLQLFSSGKLSSHRDCLWLRGFGDKLQLVPSPTLPLEKSLKKKKN